MRRGNRKSWTAIVCLRCQPDWIKVDRLILRDTELQHEKETAVERADFGAAARHRAEQSAVRRQLSLLLRELLKSQT
jgi:hypothetical protein